MNKLFKTAAILVLIGLTGCAATGPDIRTDFDQSVDFQQYQTFGFIDPLGTDKSGYSTLVTAYFKEAATQEMQALGYRYSEASPDLLVNFFMNTENRTEVRSGPKLSATYNYYYYRSGLYLGFPLYDREPDTRDYKVGTLNIDVVDASEERLIWEGIAEGKMSQEALNSPRESIQGAVQQIFQHYPTAPRPENN
ncbi:DUF4136 domain-containing protein [Gilvimarinus agarilyticus]|uniref:DUF4136 domain-containing protein n=1 Tax=unclassified Gilvimarinus TaxID=2642066 RepID=UPI001C0A2AB9|nr:MULTISPECIES: DUF4136 domain-containing protein [unclassified Gilvimarinus]MBU2884474.1 DUF4136 domain-containing protein [Gilvimarinus agarilyticus]MDO6569610.1 DUF4136 domain-containing protein [Gilvimarinus sp. 2_MG-2023]MDO6748569.1 DUF4136 domain-containing protein [Gilvimarinus sp. 1_MG-2023]